MEVLGAHLVEPINHPGLGRVEFPGQAEHVWLHHPNLGWGRVVVVNRTELRLRFDDHGVFAWFSLDDELVATWQMRNVTGFAAWLRRVGAVRGGS